MLKNRSYQAELLDEPDIKKELLFQNLKELNIINSFLGGHDISLRGLKKIMNDPLKNYSIVDIGCGGGDSLKAIARWSAQKKYKITLSGVDLKEDCIEYAKKFCNHYPDIKFYTDDFRNIFSKGAQVDIVHASLFCHHFIEDDIVAFIKFCKANNCIFIINDLERNPIAYFSIKLLTRLFSKSPLVKNDAPLSVWRGFKKREWESIIQNAGIKNYLIKNCFAFRHLIIVYPD